MDNTVVIGIGDYVVVEGDTKTSTVGLGSCIGTVLYDDLRKVSGMSHIMLPVKGDRDDRPGKYADAAIPILVDEMVKKGVLKSRIKAKIAGGASLFAFKEDHLKIGDRNIEAVKKVLSEQNIPIIAKDVGGDRGRTIIFDPATNNLFIKMVKKGPDQPSERTI